LHVSDLFDVPAFLDSNVWTDKLENNWFDELKRHPTNPSLIRATLRTIGWRLIFVAFLTIPTVSFF